MTKRFEFLEMDIPGAFLITPFQTGDERGGTVKAYSAEAFAENGVAFEPAETLYITSRRAVLRGLHFQRVKPQAKLVGCISGHVWSVVVDLRNESPTVGKWVSEELSGENMREVFVPAGCAFGTLAFQDSLLVCQCGERFYSKYTDGIRWNDASLNVKWPVEKLSGSPVISVKDQELGSFIEYTKAATGQV